MYYIISAALLLAPFLLPPTAAAPTALANPEAAAIAIAHNFPEEGERHRFQEDRPHSEGPHREGHEKFRRVAEPLFPEEGRFEAPEHIEPHFEGHVEERPHEEKRSNVGLRPQKRWGSWGGNGCTGCGSRGW